MEEGKDYAIEKGGRTIRLSKESRIPFRTRESLYPQAGEPNSMAAQRGSDRGLFWSEGHLFHDLQVEVTYTHSGKQWQEWGGCIPKHAEENLPKTLSKLRERQALKMVLLGDSISEGYNASGYVDAPPHQPPYGELVAASLRETYGSEVAFKNLAVAGRETLWGIEQVASLLAEKPDLALIAFGMNDAGGKTPEEYTENIRQIVEPLRAHGAEVILIATMTGNPEWTAFPDPSRFLEYRDALAGLTGEGVALADVTSVWTEIVRRKKYLDLSGNGLNHPNDFGHRLYAQVILALLRE
jgi:lysophospholipase L1-like esterase